MHRLIREGRELSPLSYDAIMYNPTEFDADVEGSLILCALGARLGARQCDNLNLARPSSLRLQSISVLRTEEADHIRVFRHP